MSAGQPNWQRLSELGKLPKEARGKIPLLGQLDSLTEKIYSFREELCMEDRAAFDNFFPPRAEQAEVKQPEDKSSGPATAKCLFENCDYVAEGASEAIAKNKLRLHAKSHELKPGAAV